MSKPFGIDIKAQQILALYQLIEVLLRQLPPSAQKHLERLVSKRTRRAAKMDKHLRAFASGEGYSERPRE